MLDYNQIQQVFPSKDLRFYNHELVREIETLRKTFDGVLFIDRVLAALGLAKGNIYPPRGEDGLKHLHRQVCDSPLSAHHKLSILYYLLLDHDSAATASSNNGNNSSGARSSSSSQHSKHQRHPSQPPPLLAEPFAARTSLPRKYQILMKGLWHLDRQQFRYALEHLAHPSLARTPEFADEILAVLVRHAPAAAAAGEGGDDDDGAGGGDCAGDYALPLAYYATVQPVLRSSASVSLLFAALARTSVTEALYFARRQPPPARQVLFEQLVASVVAGGGSGGADHDDMGEDTGDGSGGAARRRRKELVSLAFDEDEERWFRQYLGAGDGRKYKDARATLGARRALHSDVVAT